MTVMTCGCMKLCYTCSKVKARMPVRLVDGEFELW